MRFATLGLGLAFLAGCTHTSSRPVPAPAARECRAPAPALLSELDRLLASAAGHASHSEVCADGMGVRVALTRLSACLQGPASVALGYHVTVREERGGECSPYPACAEPPPPIESDQAVVIGLSAAPNGLSVIVPTQMPGVALKAPLDKPNDTGCDGMVPPFVPLSQRIE